MVHQIKQPMQLLHKKLKDIVLEYPSLALKLDENRIDFCCQGNRTLSEACMQRNLSPEQIESDLIAYASQSNENAQNFADWDLNTLISYIVNHHHAYIREKSPLILRHIRKVTTVHGENHPELFQISMALQELLSELYDHIIQEEEILFPYLIQTNEQATEPISNILKPLAIMEDDHLKAGIKMNEIYHMTNGYNPPEDACTTYKLTFAELQDFEKQLHEHIYLENYLVFPNVHQ